MVQNSNKLLIKNTSCFCVVCYTWYASLINILQTASIVAELEDITLCLVRVIVVLLSTPSGKGGVSTAVHRIHLKNGFSSARTRQTQRHVVTLSCCALP